MKKLICVMAIFLIMVCSAEAQHSLQQVEWLVGKWKRTDVKPGRQGVETWTKISTNELKGLGVNLKGADTVFVEKLKIILKDNVLHYVSEVPENKKPVAFRFTSVTSTSFVCENADHDFPKKITYQLEGNKLHATISGDGKLIDYFFEQINTK